MKERGSEQSSSAANEKQEYKNGFKLQSSTDDANKRVSPIRRFYAELLPCQPHFLIRDSVSDRALDVRRSFAPTGCLVTCWKLGCLCFALSTMLWQWISLPRNFYLAYMTSWGVFFSCGYFFISFLNTLLSRFTKQPALEGSVGVRIRLTWILAQIASLWEAVVTIKYWYFDHDFATRSVDFFTVTTHGVFFILVAVDVFVVNRIPFRWMHWTCYVLMSQAAWVLWSYLHAHVGDIGNPYTTDPDDEVIYDIWDWKNDPKTVLTLAFLDLFVLSPLTFMVLWIFSVSNICCCCRQQERLFYIEPDSSATGEISETSPRDVEEGRVVSNK